MYILDYLPAVDDPMLATDLTRPVRSFLAAQPLPHEQHTGFLSPERGLDLRLQQFERIRDDADVQQHLYITPHHRSTRYLIAYLWRFLLFGARRSSSMHKENDGGARQSKSKREEPSSKAEVSVQQGPVATRKKGIMFHTEVSLISY